MEELCTWHRVDALERRKRVFFFFFFIVTGQFNYISNRWEKEGIGRVCQCRLRFIGTVSSARSGDYGFIRIFILSIRWISGWGCIMDVTRGIQMFEYLDSGWEGDKITMRTWISWIREGIRVYAHARARVWQRKVNVCLFILLCKRVYEHC